MSGVSTATMLAVGSAALTVVSGVMSFAGSQNQAGAQEQAGRVAMQNAQLRRQQAEAQAQAQESAAQQNRAAANDAAAIGQRQMIEAKRKGAIMAGRAQAVMGASGAGVDPSMTAGLLAEGNYAGDVANYEGRQRERGYLNEEHVNNANAAYARYSGQGAVWQGAQTQAAYNTAAGNTRTAATGALIGSVAKAGIGLAAQYGGDWGGGDTGVAQSETAAAYATRGMAPIIYNPLT